MKPLLPHLLAALVLLGNATVSRACQYCQMAASDPEMAKLAAQMHAGSGGFPLDASLNKFQAAPRAAVLIAPPTAASVATTAADLPAAVPRRALPPATAAVAKTTLPPPAPSPASAKDAANRWANGGLLGLAGLAGVFGWRTRARRADRSAS